ncbi:hypothetical protein B0H17DRAFT_1208236 [Mycena rosella]|uniref:Uncharacterized protein n=1 Tax=Mycena rosella TaxID=1033263 RepID=A0AAD7D1L6_MYCRO|nr:hypothetical protein B0H17DRAFT_1208236 [Mycena rosella]
MPRHQAGTRSLTTHTADDSQSQHEQVNSTLTLAPSIYSDIYAPTIPLTTTMSKIATVNALMGKAPIRSAGDAMPSIVHEWELAANTYFTIKSITANKHIAMVMGGLPLDNK